MSHVSGDPRYQAVNSSAPGFDGVQARIKALNATLSTSSSRHVAAFVRASIQPDHGTQYMHAGWITGNCGSSTPTSPKVFVAWQNGAGETCTVYPGYFLSSGAAYDFRVYNSSTNTWKAQFKETTATTWDTLETRTLGFGPSTNYPAMAMEYTASSGTRAKLDVNRFVSFTEGKRRTSGTWNDWGAAATTAGQDLPTPTNHLMALGSRYDRWYASTWDPEIDLSASPSSLTVGLGQQKSATITTATNVSFAPHSTSPSAFFDPISYTATSSSSSVLTSISNPPESADPRAFTTFPATLTVTSLSATPGIVNVTVTATSNSGVTDSIVVPVTVTVP